MRLIHPGRVAACVVLLAVACGDGTSGAEDGGLDSGRRDAGGEPGDAGASTDAGGSADAGNSADAGDAPDAGPSDAGADASGPTSDAGASDAGTPSSCDERLGAPCGDSSECGGGFECEIGRCRPQGRELCGGFAGAPCTMPPYTECVFYSSADFGPCLTPEERDCVCARHPGAFQCEVP